MDQISTEQQYLQTCSIDGHLRVSCYDGHQGQIVTLYGDPDGLRSLAKLLNNLATLNQQSVPIRNLPIGEGFHLHLLKSRGLASGSLDLDLGRSDKRVS